MNAQSNKRAGQNTRARTLDLVMQITSLQAPPIETPKGAAKELSEACQKAIDIILCNHLTALKKVLNSGAIRYDDFIPGPFRLNPKRL